MRLRPIPCFLRASTLGLSLHTHRDLEDTEPLFVDRGTFEANEPIMWVQIVYPNMAPDKISTLQCIGLNLTAGE